VDGIYVCFSYGRHHAHNRACYIPCQHCTRQMILDGELMPDGQYIAFDLIAIDNRFMKNRTFAERIRELERIELPVLHYKPVKIKQFWATSEIEHALSDMRKHKCDGLVFHNPHGALNEAGTMYKWKPLGMHTVDLAITDKYILRTRKTRIQTLAPEFQDQIKPGEIWEFKFNAGSKVLTPIRQRTDKDFPNADPTYRDVRKAFIDNITEEELVDVLA